MSAPAYLGPRASVLLGLLNRPMTVHDLADLVYRGVFVLDELHAEIGEIDTPLFGRVNLGEHASSLRAIDDAGTPEIRRLLERLERMGWVSRLSSDGSELWWRT